ncbi:hypothetical protein [Paraburkholderia strydomiana]|uniref:hypothetical protein n=1 Tax=Paraburkholderia strydomiana TaxID=1245417 RepID=UPI001BECC683|nr:hypothetical protein [Paraburkholderia strydomiana]MBT2793214.1 hypothetical protein [Paraburkholderia strydomiana]
MIAINHRYTTTRATSRTTPAQNAEILATEKTAPTAAEISNLTKRTYKSRPG